MNHYRKNSIWVGVLFIIGTAAGISSVLLTQSVSSAAEYLPAVANNQNQTIIGALCIFLMGLALALIPAVLFPVLKKINEVLAIGYVIFRGVLETVTYMGITLSWLLIAIFSREFVDGSDPAAFQRWGATLLEIGDSINILLIILFSLGALMLYYLLYTSQLVPRWLSIWGLIAILLHFATGFLDLFGLMDSSMSGGTFILNFPIFLQEMVMAVWLIVKGFNPIWKDNPATG